MNPLSPESDAELIRLNAEIDALRIQRDVLLAACEVMLTGGSLALGQLDRKALGFEVVVDALNVGRAAIAEVRRAEHWSTLAVKAAVKP